MTDQYYQVIAYGGNLPLQARQFAGRIGKHLGVDHGYNQLQFGEDPLQKAAYLGAEINPVQILEAPEITPEDVIVGFWLDSGVMFEFEVEVVLEGILVGRFTTPISRVTRDGTTRLDLSKVAITQVNPTSWVQEYA